MNSVLRRSWAEVDLDVIRTNYRTYLASLREGQRIMAVVKADAYGHGDVEVASCLAAEGVRDFAVSNLLEAIRLREAGIKGQILILGYTPTECAEDLCRYDITQALVSEEHAEALAKTGFRVKCQFAIDTGMNRVGLDADDVPFCERTIRKYAKAFELTGLFTHLCVADTDTPSAHEFTDGQISKFRAVEESIRDLNLPYIHYMNSAGGLWHNFSDSLSAVTLARLGIILYGLKPDYSNILPAPIKPALRWKTVVAMVKTIHAGETIGYGRTYTAVGDVVV
ncbi:MAG: alanine racemase, partial [Oscillospiraceae bacterium]|nr:alanine racemase [Oscillospiraceae bacterium]